MANGNSSRRCWSQRSLVSRATCGGRARPDSKRLTRVFSQLLWRRVVLADICCAATGSRRTVGCLPFADRLRFISFHDWLYHKECVAKPHPLFAGLPTLGIIDWDYYGPVIPPAFFTDQATPDDVAAAAFAVGYSYPGGYASGLLLATYRLGQGHLRLNTLRILENLGIHPAAGRLLLNCFRMTVSLLYKNL